MAASVSEAYAHEKREPRRYLFATVTDTGSPGVAVAGAWGSTVKGTGPGFLNWARNIPARSVVCWDRIVPETTMTRARKFGKLATDVIQEMNRLLALRAGGDETMTYNVIAQRIGVSVATVHRYATKKEKKNG